MINVQTLHRGFPRQCDNSVNSSPASSPYWWRPICKHYFIIIIMFTLDGMKMNEEGNMREKI
jgi:hypothetical protein